MLKWNKTESIKSFLTMTEQLSDEIVKNLPLQTWFYNNQLLSFSFFLKDGTICIYSTTQQTPDKLAHDSGAYVIGQVFV